LYSDPLVTGTNEKRNLNLKRGCLGKKKKKTYLRLGEKRERGLSEGGLILGTIRGKSCTQREMMGGYFKKEGGRRELLRDLTGTGGLGQHEESQKGLV